MKKRRLLGWGLLAAGAGAGITLYLKEKLKDDELKSELKQKGQTGLNMALAGLNTVLPKLPVPYAEDYVGENFFAGHEEFRNTGVRGGKWRLGYARASLLPVDYENNDYYLGGFLTFPPSKVQSVLDDIAVRVICLDDGSGRGAAVFAVIDCIGISSTDVRIIRSRLEDFAEENNIVSINVSATHCHSGIDTQGIWGPLPDMLKNNIKEIKKGNFDNLISGKNPEFMEKLFEKTADAVKSAFEDMKPGKFLFKTIDDLKYSRCKRNPDIVDERITKLHFIPDDGSRETVGVMMAAHPTALDAKEGRLSADYIYYIEEEVNKAGADFIFFQGPQLAVTADRGINPEGEEGFGFQVYGREIGRRLMNIEEKDEEKIAPILNVRMAELRVPLSNNILLTVFSAGAVNNIAVKTGPKATDVEFITEVGYVELGKKLRLAMVPGEFAPEMLVGGTLDEEESVTGEDWLYPPLKDMLAEGTQLTIIGLCNDSIGYILPDNNYGCIFEEGHYEEAVSAGEKTGSTIVQGLQKLFADCGRLEK